MEINGTMIEAAAMKMFKARLAKVAQTVRAYIAGSGSSKWAWLTEQEAQDAVLGVQFGEKKGEAWKVPLPCRSCGGTHLRYAGDIWHDKYCPACVEAGAGRKISPQAKQLLTKLSPEQIQKLLESIG